MSIRRFCRRALPLLIAAAAGAVPASAQPAPAADAQTRTATQPAPVQQAAPPQQSGSTATTQTQTTPPVQISVNQPPATAQTPQPPLPANPAEEWLVLLLIGLLAAVGIAVLLTIRKALAKPDSGWSLAEALSEPETMTQDPAAATPVTVTRLVPSTSRLIAFMGLFGILLLYLGFGAVLLYYFGTGQNLPGGVDEVQSFLLAGLTLFAPYVVNKFADIFKSFGNRP